MCAQCVFIGEEGVNRVYVDTLHQTAGVTWAGIIVYPASAPPAPYTCPPLPTLLTSPALPFRPPHTHTLKTPTHPQVRSQYRKIFTNMGFSEMPTNNYVESSFWNFDSLFQPQQHPARDAHDTFFLTSPATSDTFPEDYLQRVKVGRLRGLRGGRLLVGGYRHRHIPTRPPTNVLVCGCRQTGQTDTHTPMWHTVGPPQAHIQTHIPCSPFS